MSKSPTKTIEITEFPGYRLRRPLVALLSRQGEGYLAIIHELAEWMDGNTEDETITDLKASLADMTRDLLGRPDAQLGSGPQEWKRILSEIAEPLPKRA